MYLVFGPDSDDDSDDDRQLCDGFQVNNLTNSLSEDLPVDSDDSEDHKPLVLRSKPDKSKTGYVNIETNSKKRPSDSSLSKSTSKKPRISVVLPAAKVKTEDDVRKDTDEHSKDAIDDVPLAQCMKAKSTRPFPRASVAKAPFAKPELKKVVKEEGKWATLEHNGVMFPPPYHPHGIKMLYKGNITPLCSKVAHLPSSLTTLFSSGFANGAFGTEALGKGRVLLAFMR